MNHNIGALVGFEEREIESNFINAVVWNAPSNVITQINGLDATNDRLNGNLTQYRYRSVFGRLKYNFSEKYLFTANWRYDGTTRFPENNRFAFFPSFSAGWRVSEEDFFSSSVVDNLKIRGAWGKLGNQEIGNYAFLTTYGTRDSYVFGGSSSVGIGETSRLANAEITWETTTDTNIGIDAAFFEGKIEITAEYYVRNTDDILLSLPQPLVLGANPPITNAGSVQNKGFDFSINYRNTIGSDFNYYVNANIATVHNEITDLKDTGKPGREVGDPIQNIFGYVSNGLFQSQAEIDAAPDQTFFGADVQPGDVSYADINGRGSDGELTGQPDGMVNADDRKSLGSFFPKASFGLSAGLNWKSLDFSMVWQGFAGVDALTGPTVQPFSGGARPTQDMVDNFWTPENTGADLPRLSFTSQGRNYQTSDYWMNSASFIKLRNLQVGYTLRNIGAGSAINIQKIRIYVSGENLLHISGFKDIDPEFAHGNPFVWNDSNFPSGRLFLAGINITF